MALPTISQFRASVAEYEADIVVDQVHLGTPFQDMLTVREVTGEKIRVPVKYLGNSRAKHEDPEGDLDPPVVESRFTMAEYDWKFGSCPFALYKKQIGAGAGPERIFDLLREEVDEAEISLHEEIADAVITSDGSDPLLPSGLFKAAKAADTGTTGLGGLGTDVAPSWAAVFDTTEKVMGDGFLEESWQLTAWSEYDGAECGIAAPGIYAKYVATKYPRIRYDGSEKTYGAGPSKNWIPFRGAKIFKDQRVTAKNFLWVQLNGVKSLTGEKKKVPYIWLAAMKGQWMTSDGRMYPMSRTDEAVTGRKVGYYTLVFNKRRTIQRYTNVA